MKIGGSKTGQGKKAERNFLPVKIPHIQAFWEKDQGQEKGKADLRKKKGGCPVRKK